jgi:hypothetical protein
MQKIIAQMFAFVGLAWIAGGCAGAAALPSTFSSLNPSSSSLEIHNQTEIKITEGNFVVVKTNVVGYARGFSLLGFISLFPARFEVAMNRLYTKAEVQSGKPQTFENIIMEKTSAYWILFSIPRVSVRADVVEFTPNSATLIIPHTPMDSSPSPPQGDKSSVHTL